MKRESPVRIVLSNLLRKLSLRVERLMQQLPHTPEEVLQEVNGFVGKAPAFILLNNLSSEVLVGLFTVEEVHYE
jgi:hypothetical protein